jgi:hypothetical protein
MSNSLLTITSGGKLIMLEITREEVQMISFIFGLLEGWWLSMRIPSSIQMSSPG